MKGKPKSLMGAGVAIGLGMLALPSEPGFLEPSQMVTIRMIS